MLWSALVASALASPATDAFDRPTVDLRRTVWTDDARRVGIGQGSAGVVGMSGGDAQLVGSVGADAVQVGAAVPLSRVGSGLGHAAVDGRLVLASHPRLPLGVGVSARAWRPADRGTGDGGAAVGGVVELPLGPLALLGNAGATAAVGWSPYGRFALATPPDATFGATAEAAVGGVAPQVLASAWVRLAGGVGLRVGAGTTLPGVPDDVRFVASAAWMPRSTRDVDADAVVDREDACPHLPEDRDDWEDDDGCPDPVRLVVLATDELGRPIPGAEWAANRSWGQAPGGTLIEDHTVAVRAWAPRYAASTVVIDGSGGGTRVARVVLQRMAGALEVEAVDAAGRSVDATWRMLAFPPGASPERHLPGWYDVEVIAAGHAPVVRTVRLLPVGTTRIVVTLGPAVETAMAR